MQILLALLALSFIVIIHEFGHFIVAKLSGIKVLEFSLFMGPKIFGIQRGDTMYSLRLIPLGGYVRMEGEEQESDDTRAFNQKPVAVRAAVIAAGPLANLATAIIILAIMVSFTGFNTNKIGEVSDGSPAYTAGIIPGDKLVGYNGKRIFHPMDLELFAQGSAKEQVDIKLKRDGEIISRTVTPARDRYILGFMPKEDTGPNSNIVSKVDPDAPAAKAGMQADDRIVALNSTRMNTKQDINNYLNKNKENAVRVTVLRDSQEMTFEVIPQKQLNPEYYAIGIGFENKKGNIFEAAGSSVIYSISTARMVYYSLVWLITGRVSLNQMMGPVGIVDLIGNVVQQAPTLLDRLMNLFSITAFISINIGLMQLIPFPALDGSKLLLLAIEGIRKKAIPPEKEAIITMVGFILLIALMIFATYNDILRGLGKG